MAVTNGKVNWNQCDATKPGQFTKARDLAVDAAVHRLAVLRDREAEFASVQRRCRTEVWSGGYMVLMDGKPLATVTIDSDTRVSIDVSKNVLPSQTPQQEDAIEARQFGDEVEDIAEQLDTINHPPHYKQHPSGVECIAITEHMNFCLGNAVKYIWRSGLKTDSPIEDLRKAAWYIEREIARLESSKSTL